MDEQSRRAHQRFKDDQRVCRAELEDESGKSVKLSVIDLSTGGAALCGARDTSAIPKASRKPLTTGRVSFTVPSFGKRKATKTVKVGTYEVVREWPRGLGDDAGIAVRFPTPNKSWVKLMEDPRLPTALQGTDA